MKNTVPLLRITAFISFNTAWNSFLLKDAGRFILYWIDHPLNGLMCSNTKNKSCLL